MFIPLPHAASRHNRQSGRISGQRYFCQFIDTLLCHGQLANEFQLEIVNEYEYAMYDPRYL